MAIEELTDSELLEKISQKDYNAFNELWRRYDRFIISIFQKLLRDKHLAEDSYQRLFMTLWQNGHNYRGGDVKSYIQGISMNIYKEAIRENTRELPLSSFPEDRQEEIMSEFSISRNNYNSTNNGQLLEDLEDIKTKIQEFKETLPERQRKVLNLRIDNKLRWKEIAKKIKIRKSTCMSIYSRANAKINGILEEYKNK